MRVQTGMEREAEREADPESHGHIIVSTRDASPEAVAIVLAADERDQDGRSQWFWVWLDNGDRMLACYPQGNTYLDTEE